MDDEALRELERKARGGDAGALAEYERRMRDAGLLPPPVAFSRDIARVLDRAAFGSMPRKGRFERDLASEVRKAIAPMQEFVRAHRKAPGDIFGYAWRAWIRNTKLKAPRDPLARGAREAKRPARSFHVVIAFEHVRGLGTVGVTRDPGAWFGDLQGALAALPGWRHEVGFWASRADAALPEHVKAKDRAQTTMAGLLEWAEAPDAWRAWPRGDAGFVD